MSDLQSILADLTAKQLTQGEIAIKHHVSRRTIIRAAKKYGLQIGQGIKNYWQFDQSSEALAYLVGVYLTDGSVEYDYHNKHPRSFTLRNTSKEYVDYTFQCLTECELRPKRHAMITNHENALSIQDQYRIAAHNSLFASWLLSECIGKSKIPDFLFDAPLSHQLSFIAAAIDGDGHVTRDGCIRMRGTALWLMNLEKLLSIMNIRTSGCKIGSMLEPDKPYYNISIRRSDYRGLGGTCIIPEKAYRIIHAKA